MKNPTRASRPPQPAPGPLTLALVVWVEPEGLEQMLEDLEPDSWARAA